MISLRSSRNQDGFTLVELLIVVIILAILAAIIVPQFSAATDDANQAAYDTNIANIRAAIDLYRQQHTAYPGAVAATGAACASLVATGAGAGSITCNGAPHIEQNRAAGGFFQPHWLQKVPAGAAVPSASWTGATASGAGACTSEASGAASSAGASGASGSSGASSPNAFTGVPHSEHCTASSSSRAPHSAHVL